MIPSGEMHSRDASVMISMGPSENGEYSVDYEQADKTSVCSFR